MKKIVPDPPRQKILNTPFFSIHSDITPPDALVYACIKAPRPCTSKAYAQEALTTCAKGMPTGCTAGLCANTCFYWA
ncbi:hypothetical protein ACU5P1_24185 [Pseudomonas plecoglossicida]|uniref:Uncharacterized protein n=1 Tax=Pseudomonas plecoglossicida TaxID=70775 RepID=A0AAD0QXZ0_PSEDL|nr:hypothetical protein [Pseudomonas plecoglossicida]AXM97580.1 hypothetical protein DVB73_18210 [Pseudomonas plecoglossicida]QLB53312.1 hypothetical protein HAV28_23950 [Pseudomonas plecoglossicida]